MTEPSALYAFLRAEKNSKPRELLLTSRVIHDLMVAAAARNYDLLVYTPTVDSDGFDLILDDRDTYLPLQLKSVISSGRATEWSIHRRLLRPQPHEIERFGFELSPCGEGRGGGVLLIDVKANDNTVDLRYLYTDLRILTAFWLGLIKVGSPTKRRLDRLRRELAEHPSGDVNVPRTAFVEARSPEHLLALAGLHSRFNTGWPHLLHRLVAFETNEESLRAPEKHIRSELQKALRELST